MFMFFTDRSHELGWLAPEDTRAVLVYGITGEAEPYPRQVGAARLAKAMGGQNCGPGRALNGEGAKVAQWAAKKEPCKQYTEALPVYHIWHEEHRNEPSCLDP